MCILKHLQFKILFILQWILWTPSVLFQGEATDKKTHLSAILQWPAAGAHHKSFPHECLQATPNCSSQHHTLKWWEPPFPDMIILVLSLPTAAQGPLWPPLLKPLLTKSQMCFRILPEVWPHCLEWELPLLRGLGEVLQALEGLCKNPTQTSLS